VIRYAVPSMSSRSEGDWLEHPRSFCDSLHQPLDGEHRMDAAPPGYLTIGARNEPRSLSELPSLALSELGPLLSLVEKTIREASEPKRIYFGRFGHSEGFGFHIHVIPVYEWVEKLFW
jgi:diadenosine tetraphosphate (Ap4A) HIT family hydrolase